MKAKDLAAELLKHPEAEVYTSDDAEWYVDGIEYIADWGGKPYIALVTKESPLDT